MKTHLDHSLVADVAGKRRCDPDNVVHLNHDIAP